MASTNTVYSIIQVHVFEGENYDFWAVKMETLFTSLNAFEFVKEGYKDPKDSTQEQLQELKNKKITNVVVLGMIQRGVLKAIFPKIMRSKKI
ncbi:hypothetical protein J1N35_034600 [Gossypium stocksii]|uniref:DUF4219 domain-containing protein n=1 Tax=Gossypium stocksii TaxID=47602 RepID=A0A9D3USC0_9ROSI|nr:hypothetical protein J1N35_034600 [Gossypium stocksii]